MSESSLEICVDRFNRCASYSDSGIVSDLTGKAKSWFETRYLAPNRFCLVVAMQGEDKTWLKTTILSTGKTLSVNTSSQPPQELPLSELHNALFYAREQTHGISMLVLPLVLKCPVLDVNLMIDYTSKICTPFDSPSAFSAPNKNDHKEGEVDVLVRVYDNEKTAKVEIDRETQTFKQIRESYGMSAREIRDYSVKHFVELLKVKAWTHALLEAPHCCAIFPSRSTRCTIFQKVEFDCAINEESFNVGTF